jgi:hypothetical protein
MLGYRGHPRYLRCTRIARLGSQNGDVETLVTVRKRLVAVAARFAANARKVRNQNTTLTVQRALARFLNTFGEQTVDQVQAQ